MLILAFETSAKAGSVALSDGKTLLAESYQNTGLTHSQTLMSMAQSMLEHCGYTPQQVEAVAVAAGPGSFTGVRIGVAAAKGFAWGAQIPCYGVSTLESMALGLGVWEGYVLAVMDARRQQVYCALFRAQEGNLSRQTQDSAISLEEVKILLKNCDAPVFLVGDGSELCYNSLKEHFPGLRLPAEHKRHQRACGVILAAQKQIEAGLPADAAALTPNYLRVSQAERERLAREKIEKGE